MNLSVLRIHTPMVNKAVIATTVFACAALVSFVPANGASVCTVVVAQQPATVGNHHLLIGGQVGGVQAQPEQLIIAVQPSNVAPALRPSSGSVVMGRSGQILKIGPVALHGNTTVKLGQINQAGKLASSYQETLIDSEKNASAALATIGKNGC